jgi:DNA/RNA-binding domain of Phe-tRNA-synthetase-like protein
MRLAVAPAVFESFPKLRLAVTVTEGIDNRISNPDLLQRWLRTWEEAGRLAGAVVNAQSHPRVRPWREAMGAIGVSGQKFPSSVEALLRRAMKGGAPFSINPLVDFYNLVSLGNVVPAGGFDQGKLEDVLELRLTRPGDTFQALDESEPAEVAAGEVAYVTGQTVLTRHFVWRQSLAGLLTPETRSVFLVSEILGQLGGQLAESVIEDFRAGLTGYFEVAPRTFLVDEAHPSITW